MERHEVFLEIRFGCKKYTSKSRIFLHDIYTSVSMSTLTSLHTQKIVLSLYASAVSSLKALSEQKTVQKPFFRFAAGFFKPSAVSCFASNCLLLFSSSVHNIFFASNRCHQISELRVVCSRSATNYF